MKSLHLLACNIVLSAAAIAQTSFPDGTGEVAVGSFPHLDILSVDVAANTGTNQITFTIFLEGDPTNPNWGRYMIALKSDSGGATTGPPGPGETLGRPIHFPSGMTHWIGTWDTGGLVYTYGTEWTQTDSAPPVKDADLRTVTVSVPFSALALTAGETFTFDVFSSGGGQNDSAVDALSIPTSSISAWGDTFDSIEPVSFTMPSASDSDGDSLPDAWETAQFGDLTQGPAGDPDSDLLDNAGEFSRSTNPKKPDTDDDGLPDKIEDNSGTYAGPASPGTSPIRGDSDGDGYPDGAEAAGTTVLLYESNPLRKNFDVFAVPGDFNGWVETGLASPTNAMTRTGTSLTAQYQWVLDYRFIGSGQAIKYKFAGGSWSDNWGGTTGTGVPGGPDITATIDATGIHRFTFDQSSLAYTFTRPTFPDLTAYLTAYELQADPTGDADSDGLTNAAEFTGNSDPTNLDTDGDSVADNLDPDPLHGATPYDLWIEASSVPTADRDRTADPDGDGLTNLEEFLFGGNPASGLNVPVGVLPSGENIIVQWIGRTADTEATYALESTITLQPGWEPVAAIPEIAADQSGVPVGYTRWQATVPRQGAAGYLRVKGTEL